MPLVDLATAKRELRVTHDAEDADITRKLASAEQQAALFMNRNIYATQDALNAAIEAAPAALAAASTAYAEAADAAWLLATETERDLAADDATSAWRDAQQDYRMARRGIVLNDSIRTAILLITASLWEHRGDEDAIEGIPPAARAFLWPYRVGLGV